MTTVLKGKPVADQIKSEIKEKLQEFEKFPKLAIIRIGENPSDISYERGMVKACESINMPYELFNFQTDIKTDEFIELLNRLGESDEYCGIMPLRPFPKQLDTNRIINSINKFKDVDCINPENLNRLFSSDFDFLLPCTPNAVMKLLKYYQIPIVGKSVLIMNRTEVVGKPLAMMMLANDATVIITHSKSEIEKVKSLSKNSDIVVSAVGRAEMLDMEYFNEDSIVIDVGMSENSDGKFCGDVNFDQVCQNVKHITPVIGGIGSVTTACLLYNNLICGLRLLNV